MGTHHKAMHLSKRIGLMKSVAMYYWKPFNQRRLRKFYRQFIQSGALCFDIGAHVGNRTMAWSALGARIIAVEPQPVCAAYLKRRFSNNPAVTIVDEAVGQTPGNQIMHISSANPTISTLSDEVWRTQIQMDARYPVRWDDRVQVPVTTLDTLISRFGLPDFCKIDVENAEYEVLLGLTQPVQALSFEYYPPALKRTLLSIERLGHLGPYRFNWSLGESLRLQSPDWVDVDTLKRHITGYTSRREYGDIYAKIQ